MLISHTQLHVILVIYIAYVVLNASFFSCIFKAVVAVLQKLFDGADVLY